MMPHTPGPWKICGCYIRGSDNHLLAMVTQMGGDNGLVDGDNALMCAAPDLLAALESILPWHDSHPNEATDNQVINMCRAAIAKAKGE